jgi:hypothetical protein
MIQSLDIVNKDVIAKMNECAKEHKSAGKTRNTTRKGSLLPFTP